MEYQAKELFAKHDVAVTLGIVATTPEEARAAAEQLAAWSSSRLRSRPAVAARPVA